MKTTEESSQTSYRILIVVEATVGNYYCDAAMQPISVCSQVICFSSLQDAEDCIEVTNNRVGQTAYRLWNNHE